ncbi:hypothetical protein X740_16795 [Mesorhizobium sp. LNHC221B00]|nr:hypothetical protein X740_16795 [Mesorhizobium sp. LNHC221B00]
MLRMGGNAADAAVAAAIAMTVTDPANTSLGGRCHIVILGPDGQVNVIDGRSALPHAWLPEPAEIGARTVPVPGIPRAFEKAVAEHGRLGLNEVVQPAICLARDGFIVRANLANAWALMAPRLATHHATKALFLKPDGSPWRFGETFRQPELADTLAAYGETGSASIMVGTELESLLTKLVAAGSRLTMDDFAAYQALDAESVEFCYRGWKGWTIGQQGYGYEQAHTLALFEAFDFSKLADPDRWAVMLLAQSMAFREDEAGLVPDAQSLLLEEYLSAQAGTVRALLSGRGDLASCFPKARAQVGIGDTTHISAVDGNGMVASITTSIGEWFGSAVATPGGYLMAHSYQMTDGRRRASRDITHQAPTVLESPMGDRVALGAAGSEKITGAVLRAIVNIVDRNMSAQGAVADPACVLISEGLVQISTELDRAVGGRLADIGLPLLPKSRSTGEHFGLLHLAYRDRRGRLSGGADTYWDGGVEYA